MNVQESIDSKVARCCKEDVFMRYAEAKNILAEEVKDFLSSVSDDQEVASDLAKLRAEGIYLERDYDRETWLEEDLRELSLVIEDSRKRVISAMARVAEATRWAPDAGRLAYEMGLRDPHFMQEAMLACDRAIWLAEKAESSESPAIDDKFGLIEPASDPMAVGQA